MAARNGGAIYLNAASATINNSTFIQNHGGTYLVWGYGGCIYGMNAFASVNHCHFVENTSTGIGGAIAFDSVSPSVINSIFERNYSPLGGAIGILRAPTGGEIIGSLFNGNTSYFFGGALAIVGSSPKIINNTIVNGLSMYGGGLYLYQGSHPTVANCIFWGNNTHAGYGRQVMILDSESSPKFQNSTFEHGAWDFQGTGYTGVYENCIELNPMFTSIGEHPFQLLANSPCINAGTPDVSGFNIPETDLAGNTRIYDTGIDMGGYEYQSIIGIQNPLSSDKKFTVNFNYKSQELMVTFNEGFNGNSVLNVIDVQGKSIFQTNLLSNGNAGEKIIIPCRALKTTGIYIAKVQSTGKEETQKFLVVAE
jgi:predicted outer membrane repeat protein